MSNLLLNIVIIIIIIVGIFIYFSKDIFSIYLKQEDNVLPFRRKDFLLNIPEKSFFEWLQKIIPIEYIVFPQIVLSAIVKVNSSKKEFWTYQNKINRKIIDFVIFEKQYLKPIMAIEYDGKTHNRINRQKRDIFVNKVLESAKIKCLHVKHQKDLNLEEVKNKINELLSKTQKYI